MFAFNCRASTERQDLFYMSEDSSSDDGWHPSAAANCSPLKGKLEQKCWECGKSFRCMRELMSHYQSHNVQATCQFCQVTFRRMTSLSTHLANAHSDNPHCETCNLWFDNKWEFNKHQGTHVSYKCVAEDHCYGYNLGNINFIRQFTTKPNSDTLSEFRPLVSVETEQERPEPNVEYRNNTLRALEVGDIEMEIPFQTKSDESDDTDDSVNYQDNEIAVSDGDEGSSVAPGNQEVGYVKKQNDEDADYIPDNTALDSDSESGSSGTTSSTPYPGEHSGNTRLVHTTMCAECGNGPFRNVKVHLLHCTGKRSKFHCCECKRNFTDEKSMQEHWVRLHACDLCNQVFTHWRSYGAHPCLKKNIPRSSTVIYSCAPLIPNKCNLCKAFFSTEQEMLKHIVTAHNKNVSIVNKPSTSTVKQVSPNNTISTTEAQLVPSSPDLALESSRAVGQRPSPVSHTTPWKHSVGQSLAGSLPSFTLCSPSFPSPSSSQAGSVPVMPTLATGGETKYIIFKQPLTTVTQVAPQKSVTTPQVTVTAQSETKSQPPVLSSQMMTNLVQVVIQKQSLFNAPKPVPSIPGNPSAPIFLTVSAPAIRPGTASTSSQVIYRAQGPLFTTVSAPVSATNSTSVSVAKTSSSPMPPLTIVAIFKNDSRELALKKRMNTSWRSKATYPCRQCGAISRQPSLNISHRYLHRGRRLHRCHCGRTFLRQLHLLRHCVQHAETTSYVCVSCGETFEGAKFLSEHMRGISQRSTRSRVMWNKRARKECKVPLSCDCGQIFVRPSAYIWHQLKNAPKTKRPKPSK